MPRYDFKYENGHVTVYKDGSFYFTADTMNEALSDLKAEEAAAA